jgi:hypothetical protein
MFGRKRVLRIVSVLAVALAAGHLVESLRASAFVHGAGIAQAGAEGLSPRTQGAALPKSASLAGNGFGDLPPLMGITSVSALPDPAGAGDCAPILALALADEAMMDIALTAPCNPAQRAVVRHSGLSFTARTGADGRLSLRIPALDAEALVAVYLDSSEVVLAEIDVPAAASLVRFAVQAPSPVQFDLRAEEAGRVYSGKETMGAGDAGRKIVTLGTAAVSQPIIAQVYTYPDTGLASAEVKVELRVTPDTCGQAFEAQTVLMQGGTSVRGSLPLAIPACGTSGDILVLKNLVGAPTLATSN